MALYKFYADIENDIHIYECRVMKVLRSANVY